jgi:arylsulfatase
MRLPKFYDLRADPFERGQESFKYVDWQVEHLFAMYGAQAIVGEWLESFKEFPPRQKSASFSVDQVVEALMPKS